MDRRLSPMGAREIAVAGHIDRDKLRAALRGLGDEYIFCMLCDAIELMPPAMLHKLVEPYLEPGSLRPDGNHPESLLAKVKAFEQASLLGEARDMVVSSPDILRGTPVVRGTRVPVHDVAASVTAGIPVDRVLAAYPSLNADKVDLVVLYAEANPPRGRPRQSAELPESAVVITDRRLARRPAAVAPINRLAATFRLDMPPACKRSTSGILRMGNLCPGMPRSLLKRARHCRFADHPTAFVTPVHSLVAIPRNGGRDQSKRLVATSRCAHPGRGYGGVWRKARLEVR